MYISLEKIKNQLELKRKANKELLKELKEKSIIYNAEKQKKLFFNSSNSFLNRKRKLSINENENIDKLNDSIDSDDYIDSVINNTFISNKSFNNLNFSRPQRFSINLLNKTTKKKLCIKNVELFSIIKTKKLLPVSEYNFNLDFPSNVPKKDNKNDNKISELGLFSNYTKDEPNLQISYFNINESNKKENNENNSNNDNKMGLFGSNIFIQNDNNKTLFSSNITDENKKEENNIKNEKENEKGKEKEENKPINLFGDINRFNNLEGQGNKLFGESNSDNHKTNKIIEKKTDTPEPEQKTSQKGKLFSLFGQAFNQKDEIIIKEKEGDNKEKINKNLFNLINTNTNTTEIIKDNIENKDNNNGNMNKENIVENKGGLFNLNNQTNEIKEEKKEEKEKINLLNLKELKEKDIKEEKEKISLFDNIKKEEKEIREDTKNENNENNKEEKPKLSFGLFQKENKDNSPINSIFGKITEKEIINNNEQNKEDKKESINILNTNAKGSLANDNNPFIKAMTQNTSNIIPNIFSAKTLTNTTNNQNNNTFNQVNNASSSFIVNNNTSNIFNQNENQKQSLFNIGNPNQFNLNSGGMEMSPQLKSRNLFNNNNNTFKVNGNNTSIFGNGNTNQTNIFGAPIGNNSPFNSGNMNNMNKTNNIFTQNSTSLFNNQHNIFSGNNSFGDGGLKFNFGKK